MEITSQVTLIWLTAIFTASLGLVVFIGSKNLSSRAFAYSVFLDSIWIASVGFFISSISSAEALFMGRLTYFLGGCISAAFFYFFITYPEDKRPKAYVALLLILSQIVFGYLFFFTNLMIPEVFHTQNPNVWDWSFGPLSFLFELFFFGFFIFGIAILYKKYQLSTSASSTKSNLKFMLWAMMLGTFPPSLMGVILPRFDIFILNWLGPITEIIWVPIIAYSIIRYRQMNVRAVVTEVLAIAMAAIFFINIFIDTPFGIWGRVATFVAFMILAYFLIRGVLREDEHREMLHDLNTNLNQKVAEQTIEIRRSLESEKKARLELEKLNDAKDQFIMITQHHLRTPLTSIVWQIEAILSGTMGRLGTELQSGVETMKSSASRLMRIVDDFLNITAIKVGTSILDLSTSSLKPAIEDILNELRAEIADRKLSVSYPQEDTSWPALSIDYPKMREILFIVVENAVRYNHDGGSIAISTEIADKTFRLVITNTGIGIDAEEKEKIGSSLFYRGQEARKNHPIGMGIGLSVVKAIVKAHHGSFKIESDGFGTGAKVTIELQLPN